MQHTLLRHTGLTSIGRITPSHPSRRPAGRPFICYSASTTTDEVTSSTSCISEAYWDWKDYRVRYQKSGESGEAVLLVHGFGGNCDHWRKNTPDLGRQHRAYSIDLLGYGYSSKPNPRLSPPNSIYCFENWGLQLTMFIEEVIGTPTTIICNSVGGLAGLQASIDRPDLVKGVQLLDISLRGLHVKRMSPYQRPLIAAFQQLLRETELGKAFFSSVAKPQTVRNILRQAYGRKDAVTDELVAKILAPGLLPGAVDVFLDFISYSYGPLPEELLERTSRPVSIVWGELDPWEDVRLGKKLFAGYPSVTEFVTLPGVGHCPQDEAPELVNPLIAKFVAQCAAATASEAPPIPAAPAMQLETSTVVIQEVNVNLTLNS